ncbi:protein NRDE2 homolog [Copidosoma floridanum]|uniref:protein NRDE2 homolog n=1 Tax=Copidosoma floridanum TaxID=29053 RepID=UPI0006C98007|nr:protein NRDE2 homolog [Copidosoma floridanum]
MSLFPAYQKDPSEDTSKNDYDTSNHQDKHVNEKPGWLENSSYQKISECLHSLPECDTWTDSSDEDLDPTKSNDGIDHVADVCIDDVEINKPNKGHDSRKVSKKQKKHLEKSRPFANDLCYEDKSRNTRLSSLETLERAVRPSYKLSKYKLNLKDYKRIKKGRFQRYYLVNVDNADSSTKADTKTAAEQTSTTTSEVDEVLSNEKKRQNLEFESKVKLQTKDLSKKLAECPTDTNTWLEYVSLQDQIVQLMPCSSGKKNLKQMINQKKLSVVEKALASNHDSVELLKTKLQIMSELLPADQMAEQIEAMVKKDQKNIVLWQSLIMVVQTSCALCKVSKVLNLYTKCFPILNQKTKTNPRLYEKQALEVLYQCLTFLRNAGLWEQMWEIMRFNLCLNLALEHEALRKVQPVDEKTLMSMEELILTSKLPLNQLWLRIESLRESCHWTSVDVNSVDINLIGDDKRLVSAEDVSDFIYPTISKDSNFRMVILFIFSLKVPLLPSRHCVLEDFNFEEHCWNIDSLEFVLPMIYSTIQVAAGEQSENCLAGNRTLMRDLLEGKLTAGPQCLRYHPARASFLDLIRTVFGTAAQNLPDPQRTGVYVWWLRFERLLIFLAKHDTLEETTAVAANRNKKLKSMVKNLLKKPEHRNNLHFYREFALIELELGARDTALRILRTAISSQTQSAGSHLSLDEKSALFSLYRTIFEILLGSKSEESADVEVFQEVAENIAKLIAHNANYAHDMPLEEMLYNEVLQFLTSPAQDEADDAFLLPNINCDTLVCYTYYLLLNNDQTVDASDILDLFDRCLGHCDKCPRLKERFYELKVLFLQFYHGRVKESRINGNNNNNNNDTNGLLSATVTEALGEFPNNFHLLSTNALIENELPCWKIRTCTEKNVNVWSVLAKCLAGKARITNLKSIGLTDSADAMVNKMLSFHKTVSQMKKVRDCPLIWKFRMLLLRDHNLCEKKGEEIYYEAVNQCPWARSVYLNAAEIAPQILSQIQDLMKEKEIRIHVTPEELDILRE